MKRSCFNSTSVISVPYNSNLNRRNIIAKTKNISTWARLIKYQHNCRSELSEEIRTLPRDRISALSQKIQNNDPKEIRSVLWGYQAIFQERRSANQERCSRHGGYR